jgi:hypothetical protein
VGEGVFLIRGKPLLFTPIPSSPLRIGEGKRGAAKRRGVEERSERKRKMQTGKHINNSRSLYTLYL